MVDGKVKEAIEQAWLSRAKAQHWKAGTAVYRTAEVEFFAGAMTTLQAVLPHPEPDKLSSAVPPGWFICAMSGRPIVEVAK